jgi:hypothetical protein
MSKGMHLRLSTVSEKLRAIKEAEEIRNFILQLLKLEDRQSDTSTGFLQVLRLSCQYHSTLALYSHTSSEKE